MPDLIYLEAIVGAIAAFADHLNLPARMGDAMPPITQIALWLIIWIAVSLAIWLYPKVLYDVLRLRRS